MIWAMRRIGTARRKFGIRKSGRNRNGVLWMQSFSKAPVVRKPIVD